VHPDGEIAVAAAVREVGTAFTVLGAASKPLPEILHSAGSAPLFFQLYTTMATDGSGMDREYARKAVAHAEAIGFQAIFVTVDTPNTGTRIDDDIVPARMLLTGGRPTRRTGNREQTFGDPLFVQTLAKQQGFPPDRSGLSDAAGPMGPFCSVSQRFSVLFSVRLTLCLYI
jgi:hypothetical protein